MLTGNYPLECGLNGIKGLQERRGMGRMFGQPYFENVYTNEHGLTLVLSKEIRRRGLRLSAVFAGHCCNTNAAT
jgi:hypothetical protein